MEVRKRCELEAPLFTCLTFCLYAVQVLLACGFAWSGGDQCLVLDPGKESLVVLNRARRLVMTFAIKDLRITEEDLPEEYSLCCQR